MIWGVNYILTIFALLNRDVYDRTFAWFLGYTWGWLFGWVCGGCCATRHIWFTALRAHGCVNRHRRTCLHSLVFSPCSVMSHVLLLVGHNCWSCHWGRQVGWRLKGDRRIIRPILVLSPASCFAFLRLKRLLACPAAFVRTYRCTNRLDPAKGPEPDKLIVSYTIDHILSVSHLYPLRLSRCSSPIWRS